MKPKKALVILAVLAIIMTVVFLVLYKISLNKSQQIIDQAESTQIIHKNTFRKEDQDKVNNEIKEKIDNFTPEEKAEYLNQQEDARALQDKVNAEIMKNSLK